MSSKVFSLIREMNSLLDLDLKDMTTFQALFLGFSEDESQMIGSVKKTSVIRRPNHLRFIVEMPPGAYLPRHWHDCREVIKVLSGQLVDTDKPGKVWGIDEVYTIPPMVRHTLKNNLPHKTTTLEVEYFK